MLPMTIRRTGPPTTHDRITWRVPLDGAPSRQWQHAFETAPPSSSVGAPKGVKFEPSALTFRSGDAQVPEWIEAIDAWISHANRTESDIAEERRREATRAEERTAARRQDAQDANDKFRHL